MDRVSELERRYGLKNYHISFSDAAQNKVGFRGKRVLEVGGSLPERFVFDELGAEQWVAIEYFDYWEELPTDQGKQDGTPPQKRPDKRLSDVNHYSELGKYCLLSGGAEDIPPALYGQFDRIYSMAAFEHINMFPMALDKMFRTLKPGGFLFSMYSPIWSAHDGHHLPTIIDQAGRKITRGQSSHIPPWGHLLMRPPELYSHLLNFTDSEAASRIVYFVYHSSHINRLFTEDYVAFINSSPFHQGEVIGIFPASPKPEIQARLEQLYPGRKHFTNNGLMVILQRPE